MGLDGGPPRQRGGDRFGMRGAADAGCPGPGTANVARQAFGEKGIAERSQRAPQQPGGPLEGRGA